MMNDVVAVVLAGGKGSRLEPLTRDRAKPAVPFGGNYRIIDFALSNCLNSGIRKMLLLTQYKALSLDRHINLGWRQYFCHELGDFIDVVPPQQRIDEHWYQGTADAVYQNIYALEKESPEYVVVLAGDHIYKMDYSKMLQFHLDSKADLTIAALPVTPDEAKSFGVMQVDQDNRLVGFDEKPDRPKTIPGHDGVCLASMGIYIFSARVLFELLCCDANLPNSKHDFGHDIIPSIIQSHCVMAWSFADENRKAQSYWRDVGTLDAYYQANMDLIAVDPVLNMYDLRWPIRTWQPNSPPPKFVFGSQPAGRQGHLEGDGPRLIGCALDSIVCNGSIVSGAHVQRSVIGGNVVLGENSTITDSILFEGVTVGRNVKLRRVIIDKNVEIPDGTRIGFDVESDRKRGFTITDGGVVIIAKGDRLSPTNPTSETNSSATTKPWHLRNKSVHELQ